MDVLKWLTNTMQLPSTIFLSLPSLHRLQELQNWLKELPCHGIEQTPCGTERLDEGIIRAIEDQVDVAEDEEGPKAKKVVMRVRPHLLYRPLGALGITQIPDPTASYDIFDRIVNVRDGRSHILPCRPRVNVERWIEWVNCRNVKKQCRRDVTLAAHAWV